MFADLDVDALRLVLAFYALNAEATEAAHSFAADSFDERTARLLARTGVVAEAVSAALPAGSPVARDAIRTVGEVGMALAGPSLDPLYWPSAERSLRFALDCDGDVFSQEDRNRMSQFLLTCTALYQGSTPVDLKAQDALTFPEQCFSIHEDAGEAQLLVLDYTVAGRVAEATDRLALAHWALMETGRNPFGNCSSPTMDTSSSESRCRVIASRPRGSAITPVYS